MKLPDAKDFENEDDLDDSESELLFIMIATGILLLCVGGGILLWYWFL